MSGRALAWPAALAWSVAASFPPVDLVTTDAATAELSAHRPRVEIACVELGAPISEPSEAVVCTRHGKRGIESGLPE